jgi:hypothetical protein
MELKGFIAEGENKSLTCCSSITDILIGDVSLFDELEKILNQDTEKYFEGENEQSPKYGVKYVILDEVPEKETSFNDLSAEVQQTMMYASYVSGCYSEYTCGFGGFDYVIGKDGEGHSVFDELKSYIGKWVHFQI